MVIEWEPRAPGPARLVTAWTAMVLVLLLVAGVAPVVASTPVAANPAFSHYRIDAAFDPRARTLTGSMTVDWVNTTGQAQAALYFRLYPNAAHYLDGQTTVSSLTVDGEGAAAVPWPDWTVVKVDAGMVVPPGDGIEVALGFVTTVPRTSDASFGILGGDPGTGWWLADWYPILAGWEDGSGWYLDRATRFGDPTFAESATYELALTAPDDYLVVGSGVTTRAPSPVTPNAVTSVVTTAPARDLTLSLIPTPPAVPPVSRTRNIAGITVRLTLPNDQAIAGLGDEVLAIAAGVLPIFETWFGPYPEPELDITSVPLAGASGVSWSGIVWLDLEPIVADGQLSAGERARLRFVLVHELSHQWIAGVIGSNNNDHGFMSEGLANALAVLAIRETMGDAEAARTLQDVASGYRALLEAGVDGIANVPLTDDTDIAARARLVYGKAALGFEAIRQDIGDPAFFAGLAAYASDYRFAISSPDDLRRAFEAASGADLGTLWSFWFERAATTTADVDAVLAGFSAT